MSKFVKVTSVSGHDTLISPEHVVSIAGAYEGTHSRISFTGPDHTPMIEVRGSPEAIAALVEAAKGK